MKKAKIMLMSIAVLAVVGGALAFNAHKDKRYCISEIQPQQVGQETDAANCNINVAQSTTINGTDLLYEFPTAGTDCDEVTTCKADLLVHE